MIIIYHIVYHCVRVQLIDLDSIERMGNGLFSYPVFYKRLFLVQFAGSFGLIANAIFLLISGYFLVERRRDIKLGKIGEKLLLQLGFATVMLVTASAVYFFIRCDNTRIRISLRSVFDFNSLSWYAGYYFVVITIGAVFLNELLNEFQSPQYRAFLITVFAFVSFSWTGGLLDSLASGLRTALTGVFLYSLGGYIRKYNPFGRVKLWALVFLAAVIILLLYVSYFNVVQNGIRNFTISEAENAGKQTLFTQPVIGISNYMAAPVILAIIIFELFRRLRMPENKVLNFAGSATFMIYLIHDNDFWRELWREADWMKLLHHSSLKCCILLGKWTGIVFLSGILTYMLYLGMMALCRRFKWIAVRDSGQE